MLSKFLSSVLLFFLISLTQATTPNYDVEQNTKSIFSAIKISTTPKIDGVLDDGIWDENSPRHRFSQFEPDNGADASFETQFQIFYNDKAIYIMARMFDDKPDEIKRELGLRDDGDRNTDQFAILFDTYNKGQNGFIFGVTAAGVQFDSNVNNDDFDDNWDAVWNSAIKIDDKGWVVEMEIPYYAIRFPKQDIQTWGVNVYRKVQRKKEESFWNHVDKSIQGFVNQSGILNGIEGVEPPLRLALMPYASFVHSRDQASGRNDSKFNGGMDLKYGINEAFTLDMSLIPDFSQVQSDDQVLNLSAFEVRFNENRPFFTEGTDLFNRGGLFYSRRVGRTLGNYEYLTNYDSTISTPGSSPLLNATKLSGRTKKGMGIGLFNGVTRRTYAEIATPSDINDYSLDADGNRFYTNYVKKEVLVDPLTNYNVFVIDQNLKNNSNIALINTNVSRTDGYENVNFTGMEFSFFDKTMTYNASGFGTIGLTAPKQGLGKTIKNDKGFKYNVSLGKVSGNWQFRLQRNAESDGYNPNDLGFNQSPNGINNFGQIRYSVFNPVWILNNWSTRINLNHNQLYKHPLDGERKFTGININLNFNATFKNFWEIGGFGGGNSNQDNYFAAQDFDNMPVFSRPESYFMGAWIGTDNRKALYVNFEKGIWKMQQWSAHDHWHNAFVRYRISDKLSVNYSLSYMREYNSPGFVTSMTDEIRNDYNLVNKIVFGERNVKTTENLIGIRYTFNNKMGLNLRVRHYWSTVDYSNFYELDANGDLLPLSYDGFASPQNPSDVSTPNHDENFNAFNIDLNYSWQIAPGSFVTINWKDAIFHGENIVEERYGINFNNTVRADQQNTFSVKITYFIDYLTLKNSTRKNRNSK